jgi:predicted nucleotidyltransferase
MLHQSFQPHLPQVITLLQKHKIIQAYVYGLMFTDKFDDESDLNFLVTFEEGLDPLEKGTHLWDLYYEIKDTFNREVHIITERSLKNPYRKKEIDSTKLLIYG